MMKMLKIYCLLLEIYDIDSNLKLFKYNFQIENYINIWNSLPYDLNKYPFINGYKIAITNVDAKRINFINDFMFSLFFIKK